MIIRVTHYQRLPQEADFSIERVFDSVRAALPPDIRARPVVCRFPSRGIFKRVFNAVEAVSRQGDVNHITGDVHYLACFLEKTRTILTIHDLNTAHRLSGWKRRLFVFLWFRLPIRRVSRVTVISNATKSDLLEQVGVGGEKVRVIHDPVSSRFQFSPRKFNTDNPRILVVGTGANKNLIRCIGALSGIPCHLRIIGKADREQAEYLDRHSREYSLVSNLSDDQVAEEYRLCDMLLFPSTFEGFGLPIIEAQATGRPVVTSNILPMIEVAGEAACLVDPFDRESIRDGILKVIGNRAHREALVEKGLRNVRRFRSRAIAEQYAALYREVMKESARS